VRIWLFRLILCLIPLAFFALLELGLRVAGFGHSYPLFIADPSQPGYKLVNPDVIKRYFPKPEMAPPVNIESIYFTENKRPDALRIVVQGESSAAGYPYGLGASLAGMLQQRLQNQYPNRYVEVIQTSMAAVNSYTLLDFSDEILAIKPDAVVIYAGHNEYLGIMGVGSAFANHARAATLLMLKLKDLRIYQLLQRIYVGLQPLPAPTEAGNKRTLMAQVARNKNIAMDSDVYEQGLAQFEGNMQILLDKYHRAGVPVYIGTVASNLRDQVPFVSASADQKIQQDLASATDAISAEVSATDATVLAGRLREDLRQSEHALLAYKVAQLYDRAADYEQARAWYINARDWDQLRFRAPSAINERIRHLAEKNGAYLVESEQELERHSPQQIIGKELMLEHLHPNIDGYFWLSDSYYNQLLAHLAVASPVAKISAETARSQVPVLPAEIYTARANIERLVADYPYAVPARPIREVPVTTWEDQLGVDMLSHKITWVGMVESTLQRYQRENNLTGAASAATLLADANPTGEKINFYAATLLIQTQRYGEAIRLLQRCIQKDEKNLNAYLALAHATILVGDYEQGERLLDKVLAWKPDNQTARQVKRQLEERRASQRK
jgi:hypothetical protein